MSSPKVLLQTDYGDITIELNQEKAPISVKNFIDYVKSGFYDDTLFHRVIDGFMIQGGGFDEKMVQKESKAPIQNEANNGLKNDVGTIAMARTSDPHSASSQFFINVVSNNFLNFKSETEEGWGYAVFGKVTDGMDTVEKITSLPTGSHGFHRDVPVDPVGIKKATLIDEVSE